MPLAIFDLDNTLIDRTGPFGRWAAGFVARRRLDAAETDWLRERDGDGFTPRPEFLAAVRERYGLSEPLDDLLRDFRDQIVALTEPDPAVAPALDALRDAGWRVAVATNGTSAQQRAKIRRAGLDSHVDAVAVSEEVGAAKPDPRVFEVAAQRCGARLDDGGWMVGDCPIRDVQGGRGVGLRTVWLRRGRTWAPGSRPPDATIETVVEALPIILGSTPPDWR